MSVLQPTLFGLYCFAVVVVVVVAVVVGCVVFGAEQYTVLERCGKSESKQ